MSFNGSGTFLINTAGQPVVSGTVISSTAFNALTADLATGLSTAITKDGQTTVTANIPMSTYKFTGLGVGSAATDSANLSQVQSTVTKLLNSVSGADTITATASPTLAAYAAGQMFYFVAAGDNTTSVTLNIDSLGAKAVTRDGSVALAAADIKSGEVIVVVYDGTRFQVVSQLNSAGDARFANVSIASSLYVGGVSTFVGNAGFSANVSIASALSVGGVAAITGATTIGGNLTLSGGTANGVLYLNGSKVATSGAVLVFDGTNLGIGTTSPITKLDVRSDAAVVATSGYSNLHFNALPASATARAATIRKNYDSPFDLNIYASTGTSGNSAATIFYRDITNESMRIDSSGNLGLGVTPSAWGSGTKAFQNSAGSLAALSSSEHDFTQNAYNNGSNYIYVNTAAASVLRQTAGSFRFYNAPSGTAGNAISFTQALTLDASGNLLLGTTTSPSGGGAINARATTGTHFFDTTSGTEVIGIKKANGNTAYLATVASNDASLQVKDSGGVVNLTVGTSGNSIALKDATPQSGVGITFPATQSASSNANTLDDYEEGTWTPVIAFGGSSAGITYTEQVGRYTKVGRLVTLQFSVTLSNKGAATGTAVVNGVPYVAYALITGLSVPLEAGCVQNEGGGSSWPANSYGLVWTDGNVYLRYNDGTSYAALTNSNFTNTTSLYMTVTYEVA